MNGDATGTKVTGGTGSGYFTQGVLKGEVRILGKMEGLSIFAQVYFDTGVGAAEVTAIVNYVKEDKLSLHAMARIPIGFCDPTGAKMIGTAKLNAAPLATLSANARVVRHCEAPEIATERYGYVWLIQLNVDEVSAFDNAIVGKDLEYKITGRQVGNTSASLEWALVAEGILEIGTGDGVPSALAQVELVASFRTKIILSSGGGNKTSAAIADGKNATTTTPSALGAADAANAISRHTTRKTKPSMLGADAKKNASDTGLKYFDVNATATFQAGYDPITDGPIFGITATFNFTYPAVAPVEIDAHACVQRTRRRARRGIGRASSKRTPR